MRFVDLSFIAAAVVPGDTRKQLLIGFVAGTELGNQCRCLLAAKLHHGSAVARNDEHAGFRNAVVEWVIIEAHRCHSPVITYPVSLVTMSISLSRLDPNGADRSELIDFFTSNDFPFHVRPERWTAAGVEERIESGAFRSDDYDTFWLQHEQLGNLGIVRLEDLTEDTPMFDLRLATERRGQGLGTECLRTVTDHVFMTMDVDRFEGNTRDDNIAMRALTR
ncbi:GNAT family N-acetyltransferase [Brevibacterium sp. UCMA 11754]|uniref:GNAT family N-acetyltransferase n=1 Tax=Brevibacterium sp. UCMA 11754 TaxID=2749198 RepID=UPI001F300CF2|nr:GNAT family N-acetyltransferase [Brevibacterium sp. UCMA 11754]MCF2571985.1 GNAT family N-acetyltransferase [Brevibacterium sp. UCMA 11754]